jgi:hypothetical protein
MTVHLILTDEDWTILATEYGMAPNPMPKGKVWNVKGETFVHRDRVAEYVINDPELQRHAHTILHDDWPYLAEHLAWVANTTPAEVSEWARQTERALRRE